MKNDIAIYAMGGGFGHIMRASGLAHGLLRLRPDLSVCLYVPDRGGVWVRRLGLRAIPAPSRRRAPSLGAWAQEQILSDPPRLLVVDCFPLGLYGELAPVLDQVEKSVFLSRWLAKETVAGLRAQQALKSYSLRIRTEKIHPTFESYGFQAVEPVLSVRAEDVLTRDAARAVANLEGMKEPLVFLVTTSDTSLGFALRHIVTGLAREHRFHLEVLTPSSRLSCKLFPLARFLRAADLVICLAGNNLYYELVQAGVPAILVPSDLANDNHQARAQGELAAIHPHSRVCSANEIHRFFPEMLSRPLSSPRTFLGAEQASKLILRLFEHN